MGQLSIYHRWDKSIRWPVIAVESDDLFVFASPEGIERKIELPDVEAYRLFDSNGQSLEFIGLPPRLGLHATGLYRPDELIELLKKFLRNCNYSLPESVTLDGLIGEVARVAGTDP